MSLWRTKSTIISWDGSINLLTLFLGRLRYLKLLTSTFVSNWQLLFMNQWKGENDLFNYLWLISMKCGRAGAQTHDPGTCSDALLTALLTLSNIKGCSLFEPHHDKTNKAACAPSEDSDQPGHPPSLIRVFAVRTKKALVLNYPLSIQRRLWSDWMAAQADLSLRWAHRSFCWFCRATAH